jgi:hypothetical protein
MEIRLAKDEAEESVGREFSSLDVDVVYGQPEVIEWLRKRKWKK